MDLPDGVEPLTEFLGDLFASEAYQVAQEFCVGESEHEAVDREVEDFRSALVELVRRARG